MGRRVGGSGEGRGRGSGVRVGNSIVIRAGEGSGRRPPTGLRDGPRPRGGRARGDASEGRARGVEVARRTISPGGRARSPASGDAGPRRGQRARGRRRAGARGGRGGGEGRAGRKRGRGRNNPPRPGARARARAGTHRDVLELGGGDPELRRVPRAGAGHPAPRVAPERGESQSPRHRSRGTARAQREKQQQREWTGGRWNIIRRAVASGTHQICVSSFHLDPSDADAPSSPRLSPPLRAERLTARRTPSPSSSPPSARPSPASSSPPPPRR